MNLTSSAKLTLFVSLITFSSHSTWAAPQTSIAGTWRGTGQAVFKADSPQAHGKKCSQIEIEFKQDGNHLKLVGGSYHCQDLEAAWDPAEFEVQNGALMYKGQKVGSLTPEQIEIDAQDSEDGSTFHFTLTVKGSSAQYSEEWIENGQVQLRISGLLKSQTSH